MAINDHAGWIVGRAEKNHPGARADPRTYLVQVVITGRRERNVNARGPADGDQERVGVEARPRVDDLVADAAQCEKNLLEYPGASGAHRYRVWGDVQVLRDLLCDGPCRRVGVTGQPAEAIFDDREHCGQWGQWGKHEFVA
ncbi:hypothetical protein [Frankia sp. KB5]|uniref:hypothetical protein n=1 Tax=Frankia sp. KB5 TaxID=683318 RepID=UPI001F530C56|nr:hypothetical protein [Frankia sp. KB5]